mmetsp:Transcript_22408/g.48374  ORF Transcript_22408/g.48374 Transcript_22408/m.48374 type:complete len:211 (-) Transcript_22408:189-821(-)
MASPSQRDTASTVQARLPYRAASSPWMRGRRQRGIPPSRASWCLSRLQAATSAARVLGPVSPARLSTGAAVSSRSVCTAASSACLAKTNSAHRTSPTCRGIRRHSPRRRWSKEAIQQQPVGARKSSPRTSSGAQACLTSVRRLVIRLLPNSDSTTATRSFCSSRATRVKSVAKAPMSSRSRAPSSRRGGVRSASPRRRSGLRRSRSLRPP